MTRYGYPILPQTGLCNMLLPWADCLLWCRDHGATMIAPTWRKVRIGPYLRRERDRRDYHRLFHAADGIAGFRKWALLLTRRRVPFSPQLTEAATSGAMVTFRDLNSFTRLAGRHGEVAAGLRGMTQPGFLPAPAAQPFIGLHVRLGDYAVPGSVEPRPDVHFRLQIVWYLAALRELRARLDEDVPAVLFSDGTDDELRELLQEKGVSRSPYQTAVTDLLALSGAGVMVASCSTFSLWGSFLGQVPALWHPGTRFRSAVTAAEPYLLEPEWSPGCPLPAPFIDAVRARFTR